MTRPLPLPFPLEFLSGPDREVADALTALGPGGAALRHLLQHEATLSDAAYWALVGALWVTPAATLAPHAWDALLRDTRPERDSLMEPAEHEFAAFLPAAFTAWCAARPRPTGPLALTLDPLAAHRSAQRRGLTRLHAYHLTPDQPYAAFLRRGMPELLLLDPPAPTWTLTLAGAGRRPAPKPDPETPDV